MKHISDKKESGATADGHTGVRRSEENVFAKKKYTRIIVEFFVVAFGFLTGFFLMLRFFPSVEAQMVFDEQFFGKRIYPEILKSSLIMAINNGILLAVCLRATLQLFFHRFTEIGFGIQLCTLCFFSCSTLYLIMYINVFVLEFNILLFLAMLLIVLVVSFVNLTYVFYSSFSTETRTKFFSWPNWFCSLGLFSLILNLWHLALSMMYIPI